MIPRIALLAVLIGLEFQVVPLVAQAQSPAAAPLEVALVYSTDRTNGVVGGRGCFWMQGGKSEASAYFGRGLSVVAELGSEHANSINSAHEGLGLVTFLFGPRYSLRSFGRFTPFAQTLMGGVHGFDALFPNAGGSAVSPVSPAFALGGGLNGKISRRLGFRFAQIDYLQTRLPNGTNGQQNHLRISAGVVFRFGENTP